MSKDVNASAATDGSAAFPFLAVEHLARNNCQCQRNAIDVDTNYHVGSCMVGMAQRWLAKMHDARPGTTDDVMRIFLERVDEWYRDASSGMDVLASADLDEIAALVDAARP